MPANTTHRWQCPLPDASSASTSLAPTSAAAGDGSLPVSHLKDGRPRQLAPNDLRKRQGEVRTDVQVERNYGPVPGSVPLQVLQQHAAPTAPNTPHPAPNTPPRLFQTHLPNCRTSCITSAVAGSTEDVASSSSSSRGVRSSTRASASSCCWPWDSAAAPSPSRSDSTAASSARCAAAARSPLSRSGLAAALAAAVLTARAAPPRGAAAAGAPATAPATVLPGSGTSRGRHRCTLCSAAARSAVLCWHSGSRFSRTGPSNRKGCCGTTPAQRGGAARRSWG